LDVLHGGPPAVFLIRHPSPEVSLPSLPSSRRAACLVVLVTSSAGTLAACGSSSSPNAAAPSGAQTTPGAAGAQARPGGFGGLASDPKVVACLKKEGVALPSRGARPGGQGGGVPPAGGTGTAPNGGSPGGARPGGGGQFQKVRDALKKCGITLPGRPGGATQGAPPSGTTNSPAQGQS
jgi:hypothetical protein